MKKVWIFGLLWASNLCLAVPYRPVDPSFELAHGLSPYREHLTGPQDLNATIAEARALVQEGRRKADVRAFSYAEKRLAPFSAQFDNNDELALLSADIHQYRHDFTGALVILDKMLVREPSNSSARLMRAEILLAQGRGRDALHDCLSLVGKESPWIWSACSAQSYAIAGRLTDAKQLLATTLRTATIDGPQGAWAAGIMADLEAQSGDGAASEVWLKKALAANPDDHVAAVELLDTLIATGRSAQALELLDGRPVSDAYLIRKAEALATVDAAQSALVVADLQRRFTEADALNDRTHLRERAMFELLYGDPRSALIHARENFRTQRELVDAHLVLQAAATLHDKEGASDVFKWLHDTKTQDARLKADLDALGVVT